MKVDVTEYLGIELSNETWVCRRCAHEIGPARENYKKGLRLYRRNPQEIHRPILDPARYRYTFAPDPAICSILECYCPGCGTLVETEYLPPGMRPTHDLEFDIDALKAFWSSRDPASAGAPVQRSSVRRACTHSHRGKTE